MQIGLCHHCNQGFPRPAGSRRRICPECLARTCTGCGVVFERGRYETAYCPACIRLGLANRSHGAPSPDISDDEWPLIAQRLAEKIGARRAVIFVQDARHGRKAA